MKDIGVFSNFTPVFLNFTGNMGNVAKYGICWSYCRRYIDDKTATTYWKDGHMKILRFPKIWGSPNHPLNIFVLIMNTIQLLGLPPIYGRMEPPDHKENWEVHSQANIAQWLREGPLNLTNFWTDLLKLPVVFYSQKFQWPKSDHGEWHWWTFHSQ